MRDQMNGHEAVIGVFSDPAAAERAVAAMLEQGVDGTDISVLDDEGLEQATHIGARRGLVTGAAVGSAGAALLEATVLAFPPAAIFIAGGTMAAALAGLTVGAGAGAVAGSLVTSGTPSPAPGGHGRPVRRAAVAVTSRHPDVRDRARVTMRVLGALETRDLEDDARSGPTFATGFADVAPDLKAHLRDREGSDRRWPEVEPIYRYGWQLANRPDYDDRTLDDARDDIRREWQRRHPDRGWAAAAPYVAAGWAAARLRSAQRR
ncbi:MAG TPA: hypothetical protein VJP45_02410 [Candidatus Limnocylindria bacterium]|nr:hypothetical protein [Candidatus Limnocylindria bacterium]